MYINNDSVLSPLHSKIKMIRVVEERRGLTAGGIHTQISNPETCLHIQHSMPSISLPVLPPPYSDWPVPSCSVRLCTLSPQPGLSQGADASPGSRRGCPYPRVNWRGKVQTSGRQQRRLESCMMRKIGSQGLRPSECEALERIQKECQGL